jgi:hypothetical protein
MEVWCPKCGKYELVGLDAETAATCFDAGCKPKCLQVHYRNSGRSEPCRLELERVSGRPASDSEAVKEASRLAAIVLPEDPFYGESQLSNRSAARFSPEGALPVRMRR